LNNNNDNINVWSMTNVLLYSIALVNVLIDDQCASLFNCSCQCFDRWPMCFFIQLLLSMSWSMAMVTYPILSLLMLWSIWMIDQCWFSINHNVCFIQSFFLWSILLKWLFNVNGNINLWVLELIILWNLISIWYE
jgi:hypothetical protein